MTVLALVHGVPPVEPLRAYADGAGPLALAGFTLALGLVLLAPVPKNVLATGTGVLLGFGPGVVVVLLGGFVSAVVAFGLSRLLGRPAVAAALAAGPVAGAPRRWDAAVREHGLLTVVGARFSPVVPFTAFNYAAGLSGLRARDFGLGTAIGIVPGTLVYVGLGSLGRSPGPWSLGLGAALVTLLLVGWWLRRRRRPGPCPR
ncbi:MAG: VTT domain-containing protein [Nocardioides sp.]|nr:VTT domain-containing protein [Nocardioides sp.]